MRKRCARVARPTSTSSRPVANGSSVPAWPTFVRARQLAPHLAPRRRARSRRRACRRAARRRSRRPTAGRELRVRPRRAGTRPARGTSIAVEKPAARRCPPPPCSRAMRETSTRPSVARRLTLRSARPPSDRSRTSAGDRGALDRAQVVDDALGVALAGAGGLVVLGVRWVTASAPVVVALDARERRARAARACPNGTPS